MNAVEHKAILASAGSGKTFQLAQRFIRLLALGVEPERIVALTFSRKAAGEIFESIVHLLSRAALDPDEAAAAGQRIAQPQWQAGEFLAVLRCVLSRLHALRIGTLDSFSVSVLRAFPFELGLTTELRMMDNDGAAARAARREVLHQIYDPSVTGDEARRQFFEAFKQSTFGQETKSLTALLDRFIGRHVEMVQREPDLTKWGRAPAIWQNGTPWLGPAPDVAQSAETLAQVVAQSDWPETVQDRWRSFLAAGRVYGIGSAWETALKDMMGRLLPQVDALRTGSAEIKVARTACRLKADGCAAALGIVHHVIAVELVSSLARTQGMGRLLALFDDVYQDAVRRRGRLTFHDANILLVRWNPARDGRNDRPDVSEVRRRMIEDRLDARLDHWLLDEFQDTSDVQWGTLRNLIDEVVQDPGGRRSFFFVGDIKQAIYGWRGGNPHLFRRILDHYQGVITEESLATSFRSAAPIVDCVNRVFDDLPATGLSARAVEVWRQFWVRHRVETNVVPAKGYAAILEPPVDAQGEKPGSPERLAVAAALLNELQPIRKGWSVGVLVRTNDQGVQAADALRRLCPGMPIAHEGAAGILDNPVTNLLCALVQAACHPGDRLAWGHLAMSPMAPAVAELGRNHADRVRTLLRQIGEGGFQPFIYQWGVKLDAAHPLDAFGRRRWHDLWQAAGSYDQTGEADGSGFLRWANDFSIRDPAAENAVRVMTIHQSKGLGFDVVLLPELQDRRSMAGGGEVDLVAAEQETGEGVRWLLDLPRRAIAQQVEELAEQLSIVDQDRCFESLCVLYVALTRARRALYMVTSFPGAASQVLNEAAFLKSRLAGSPRPAEGRRLDLGGTPAVPLWETGDPDWHRVPDAPYAPAAAGPGAEPSPPLPPPPPARGRSVSPSQVDPRSENAGMLFQPQRYAVLDLGSAVHSLFEQVAWVDERTDPRAIAEGWRGHSRFDPAVTTAAIDAFCDALAAEEIRVALGRPGGSAGLWREKRFELMLQDEWVTGAFDRVVIKYGPTGAPARAWVQDFKTNEITTARQLRRAADHYRPQLLLYRTALARILHLPESAIALELLFTHPARTILLPP